MNSYTKCGLYIFMCIFFGQTQSQDGNETEKPKEPQKSKQELCEQVRQEMINGKRYETSQYEQKKMAILQGYSGAALYKAGSDNSWTHAIWSCNEWNFNRSFLCKLVPKMSIENQTYLYVVACELRHKVKDLLYKQNGLRGHKLASDSTGTLILKNSD